MKTKTIMKMMGQEARRIGKTARMTVAEMRQVSETLARESKSTAIARRRVEEWWREP